MALGRVQVLGATLVLDLDGRVSDVETLGQPPFHVGGDAFRRFVARDTHMQRQYRPFLRDRPDMHMVHIDDRGEGCEQIGRESRANECPWERLRAGYGRSRARRATPTRE